MPLFCHWIALHLWQTMDVFLFTNIVLRFFRGSSEIFVFECRGGKAKSDLIAWLSQKKNLHTNRLYSIDSFIHILISDVKICSTNAPPPNTQNKEDKLDCNEVFAFVSDCPNGRIIIIILTIHKKSHMKNFNFNK